MSDTYDPEFLAELEREADFVNASGHRKYATRLQLNVGESALIRYLPYRFDSKGRWFARLARHWINNRPYLCTRDTDVAHGGHPDQKCKICTLVDDLNKSRDRKTSNEAYRMMAVPQWLSYVFVFEKYGVRGDKSTPSSSELYKPQEFWMYKESFSDILMMFKNYLRKKNDVPLSILDPEMGCDVMATRAKRGWRFEREESQSIGKDPKAILDKALKSIEFTVEKALEGEDLDDILIKIEDICLGRNARKSDRRGDDLDLDDDRSPRSDDRRSSSRDDSRRTSSREESRDTDRRSSREPERSSSREPERSSSRDPEHSRDASDDRRSSRNDEDVDRRSSRTDDRRTSSRDDDVDESRSSSRGESRDDSRSSRRESVEERTPERSSRREEPATERSSRREEPAPERSSRREESERSPRREEPSKDRADDEIDQIPGAEDTDNNESADDLRDDPPPPPLSRGRRDVPPPPAAGRGTAPSRGEKKDEDDELPDGDKDRAPPAEPAPGEIVDKKVEPSTSAPAPERKFQSTLGASLASRITQHQKRT